MSWIFAALLLAYACARCVGWLQGQLRWRHERHLAETLQPPRRIDGIAAPELLSLHAALDAMRVTLARREHEIRYAAAADPDILFGKVRSNRYRIALRRVSGELNALLYELGELPDVLCTSTQAAANFRAHARWLNEQSMVVAAARALEAFDVEQVRRAAYVLADLRRCTRAWQGQLEALAATPYRDEAIPVNVRLDRSA